ncbi:hypothetical protein PanWU01x14_009420, partial [Parasponia andersonii]
LSDKKGNRTFPHDIIRYSLKLYVRVNKREKKKTLSQNPIYIYIYIILSHKNTIKPPPKFFSIYLSLIVAKSICDFKSFCLVFFNFQEEGKHLKTLFSMSLLFLMLLDQNSTYDIQG